MKKARILIRSGPLRTELGRALPKRILLPVEPDPRVDQARADTSARPAPAGVGERWCGAACSRCGSLKTSVRSIEEADC